MIGIGQENLSAQTAGNHLARQKELLFLVSISQNERLSEYQSNLWRNQA